MMNIQSLLDHLNQKNVVLAKEQGQLKVYSNVDLEPAIIKSLKYHKQEVLNNLTDENDAQIGARKSFSRSTETENMANGIALTDMQQAYWLGRRSDFLKGNTAANIYAEIEINNRDVQIIEKAWNVLIRKHIVLCTQITKDNHQQIVPFKENYSIEHEDFSCLEQAKRMNRIQQVRKRLAYKNRDQAYTRLFDLQISKLSDSVSLLHVSIDSIIIDFASFTKLCNALSELIENRYDTIPPEINFSDYLLYLNTKQVDKKYNEAQSYWRNRFNTLPSAPKIEPAFDRDFLAESPFVLQRKINHKRWAAIKEQTKSANVTPTVYLLYVYAETINYFAEDPHFLLNITISDRDHYFEGVDGVMGNFTNVLPLEVNFKERKTFLERLQSIKKRLVDDLEHRSFNGIEVMREVSQLKRSSQTLPIVFTSTLDNAADNINGGNYLGRIVYQCNPTPQVLIHNYIYADSGDITICLEFDNLSYSEDFVHHFSDVYGRLLDGILNNELVEYPLSGFDPSLAAHQYKNTEINEKNLHDLFLEALPIYHNQVAVVSDKLLLTYGELFYHSLQLSEKISQYQLADDAPIAIVMNKGWEQIVAVYGILFSGHAFLPIDATYPEARQKTILKQSRSSLLITQPGVLDKNPYISEFNYEMIHSVNQSETLSGILKDQNENLNAAKDSVRRVGSKELAYVIYTSGSTGIPKGVMISHDAALNTIADINNRYNVSAEDRVLAISSLSFDLSIYDIFAPLAVGAAIVLPQPDLQQDPNYLLTTIVDYGVTIWNSVPALFDRLVKFAHMNKVILPLKLAMLSGDWIPVDLAKLVKDNYPQLQLISLGGATEASIWSIFHVISEVQPGWKSIPYGKAMSDQTVYVLDHDLRIRPTGVAGEIYIGGRGVALGYHHDPNRTQQSFLNHPVTGERLYRTGDLGRYLENGEIELLGRTDFQVKVNGYRIELEEIEVCINNLEGIARSLVLPKKDCRNQVNYLVAFYMTEDNLTKVAQQNSIKENLQQQLPDYMVPYQFIKLDEFPLTSNGKVDRNALNQHIARESPVEVNSVENKELKMVIQGFVKEILDVDTVDDSALFFELGMTSIHMVVLRDKIEKLLNLNVDVVRFFQHPSLAQFSRYLSCCQESTNSDSSSKLEAGSARARYRRQRHAVNRKKTRRAR